MIDFDVSDEGRLVIETARAFAARELRPNHRAHETDGVSPAAFAAAAAAGLDDLFGDDLDPVESCAALEQLAFADAGATLAIVAPSLFRSAATLVLDDRHIKLLSCPWGQRSAPPSKSGNPDSIGASAGASPGARAVYVGPRPTEIPWLPVRGPALVLQLDAGAWSLLAVDAHPIAGLGLGAAGAARCEVLEAIAAGEADTAGAVAEIQLALAAMCVGLGRASLEYAQTYVQERTAFGVPLAQHQAVAFIVADVAMRIAAAHMLVHRAALGQPADAAHAFAEAADAVLFATERCLQLLGGHGYTRDHPVEKWMRDARALTLLGGGRDRAADDSADDAWERRWI